MTDIDARVAAETAARLQRHELQELHRRISAARSDIRNMRATDLPDEALAEIERVAGQLEDSAWRVEQMLTPSLRRP